MQIMESLKSDYIVSHFNSWIEFNQHIYIQMEYCSQNLDTFLRSIEKDIFDENSAHFAYFTLTQLLFDIINGLAYLHGKQIIHRDLKPLNILVPVNPENGVYFKLSDFGLATFDDINLIQPGVKAGTRSYMAPEDIKTIYSDIYSLGKIVEDLLTW